MQVVSVGVVGVLHGDEKDSPFIMIGTDEREGISILISLNLSFRGPGLQSRSL